MKPDEPALTRRGVGRRIVASLLAGAAASSAQESAGPPDHLSAAREANRKNSEQLLKSKLPASVEPTFRFEP